MAQQKPARLGSYALQYLLNYHQRIMDVHSRNADWYNKLEYIDIAYARYKAVQNQTGGVDPSSANVECGLNTDEIVLPVVVSQVEAQVGYLADIFLSGFPIFPVVSTPENRIEAEAFQSIIDDHSVRARYARQFMLNFFDGTKYNLTGAEISWYPLDTYVMPSLLEELSTPGKGAPEGQGLSINRIKRVDPYNLIWDRRVAPVDVPYEGSYVGYVEAITSMQLKRYMDYYKRTGHGYYTTKGFSTGISAAAMPFAFGHYKEHPQISNIISRSSLQNSTLAMNWDWYLTGKGNVRSDTERYVDMYTHTVLYIRVIPAAMGVNGPGSDRPQVWKICVINDACVVYAAPVFTIYDTLPIYLAQPREDGFDIQTVTFAEGAADFQEASSKLFGIRINAARRAVMDRALYDPDMINPAHMNAPIPAPKIPLKHASAISGKTIDSAYKQIPFDSRGTETVVQDLAMILRMADQLNGTNGPQQGQFQRGNKTRREWTDTMEGAYNRLRLPALSFELQLFTPVKEQIKLNIFQHSGELDSSYQNRNSGTLYEMNAEMIARIRDKIKNFQLADGFHPAEKMAGSDVLQFGFQTIQNSPVLAQLLGPALPEMFAHLMSLGGVKGIDQYIQLAAQRAQANGSNAATPNPPATPAA